MKKPVLDAVLAHHYPGVVKEYQFHATRKWRFDWAWPDKKIACEYEGGIFTGGRHTRGGAYDKDCEKYNAAAILGWRVIRTTAKMWQDGRALDALRHAHA